jgi:hypothetical protein
VTSPSLSLSLLFLFIVGAYRDFLRGGLADLEGWIHLFSLPDGLAIFLRS